MNEVSRSRSGRRATNITLPGDLVREARTLGVGVSQACEEGLRRAVAEARREAWLRENRAEIEQFNRYLADHGLPFPEYRRY